ncbi:MAG: PEP-CTERM sorting domain-containing protein [Planctomycetota bacterium]
MRAVCKSLAIGVALASAFGAHPPAEADVITTAVASDDASDPVYDNGWNTGVDGGTGFGPWIVGGSGPAGGGFIGGGTDIDVAGEAFGVFGNNGDLGEGIRDFDVALTAGQTFSITMDNGGIDNGGTVGFGLQNAGGDNLIEFFFVGGTSNYTVNAGSAAGTTPGFTASGLKIEVTPEAGGLYTLTIDELSNGSGVDHTVTGGLFNNSDQAISRLRLFNANGGPDVFFNDLLVTPEPASAMLIAAGALAMLRRRRA